MNKYLLHTSYTPGTELSLGAGATAVSNTDFCCMVFRDEEVVGSNLDLNSTVLECPLMIVHLQHACCVPGSLNE